MGLALRWARAGETIIIGSRDAKRAQAYEPWLAVANASDFLGIQTYTRVRVGNGKDMPPEPGVELTQMGYEYWARATLPKS